MDKITFLTELDKRGIACSREQLDLLWAIKFFKDTCYS